MRALAGHEEGDRRLTARMASWNSPVARRVMPAVREAAKHTRLWCGAAVLMSVAGGRRGRKAALAGLASMAVAELASNTVAKPLQERPRPPKEWIPHDDVHDRPESSSFPSGHTAAAVAFTSAVAWMWPRAATACAVPAVTVAAEGVHSGAHYPTDVAADAVIGLAATALVRAAPRLLLRWQLIPHLGASKVSLARAACTGREGRG
ncbi:hypothetical protein SUDANB105_07970 [Streptomyces sp. enrichment culture]|uniref:phosphatase PAP2 family protein n=1 Tax=Streptomyces sp. enrichment culture TaxID=1795815 RepID=UPI003F560DCA